MALAAAPRPVPCRSSGTPLGDRGRLGARAGEGQPREHGRLTHRRAYPVTALTSLDSSDVRLKTAGTGGSEWRPGDVELPPGLPDGVRAVALTATAEASSPYDKAVALQAYLRQVAGYSLKAPRESRTLRSPCCSASRPRILLRSPSSEPPPSSSSRARSAAGAGRGRVPPSGLDSPAPLSPSRRPRRTPGPRCSSTSTDGWPSSRRMCPRPIRNVHRTRLRGRGSRPGERHGRSGGDRRPEPDRCGTGLPSTSSRHPAPPSGSRARRRGCCGGDEAGEAASASDRGRERPNDRGSLGRVAGPTDRARYSPSFQLDPPRLPTV